MKTKKYWTHRIAPPQHKKYEEKKTNKNGHIDYHGEERTREDPHDGNKRYQKCYG